MVHGSPSAFLAQENPVGHSAQHLPLCSTKKIKIRGTTRGSKGDDRIFIFTRTAPKKTAIHLRKRMLSARMQT